MNDQEFEKLLQQVLKAPTPPSGLQTSLLAVANEDAGRTVPAATPAANDSLWRRALPVAACMIVLLGLAWRFQPAEDTPLAQEILRHVYAEERFLNSSNHVSLTEVNSRMSAVIKAQLASSPATNAMDVRFSKDCWIAKQKAMHLIISGDTGPVSVMMLPSKVVQQETVFNDARFTGTITPMGSGTLVVLGNRQEPVRKYASMVQNNLHWEY